MKIEEVVRQTLSIRASIPIQDSDGPGSVPGWDSLGHIRLLAAVQSEYHIHLESAEIIGIQSIADIKVLLKKKGIGNF